MLQLNLSLLEAKQKSQMILKLGSRRSVPALTQLSQTEDISFWDMAMYSPVIHSCFRGMYMFGYNK
jgi:hypothetical protein